MVLPYYKQQTLYSCALACLKMVLETLSIRMEEYQLAPLVDYDPDIYQGQQERHGHMVVVKNITDKNIIINDPDRNFGEEDKKVKLNVFIESWAASKNWLLVIGVDYDK